MTVYNPASRIAEGAPGGPSEITWQMVGFIEGYDKLFTAAEEWVRKEYQDIGKEEFALQPREARDGLLPILLGKFTTFSADAHAPTNERTVQKQRERLSNERYTRLSGFLDQLDIVPAQIYLTRQTRTPQLVAASLMIDKGHLRHLDPMRNEHDILPGTSGLRHTNDGNAFIGAPIATPARRKLWPAKPLAVGDSVHDIHIVGGRIEKVPASRLPRQRTLN